MNLTAKVCSTCVYESENAAEGVYTFPLNNVAFYSFEAEIGDRKIVAECRPRGEANTTYEEAVSTGHMAFMAEQDIHCEDIFQMKLGAIPSHTKVIIRLKYVGLLDAENEVVDGKKQSVARFTLPTVLNPRYQPSDMTSKEIFEPIRNSGDLQVYSFGFDAEIHMPTAVLNIYSALDEFEIGWTSSDHKSAKVKLSSNFKCDHDLQMNIRMNGQLTSFAVCERGKQLDDGILTMDCLMTQWMPDFSQLENAQELRTELYFVIDRSGSMSGDRIQKAAQALLLFLKSIPVGCRFQVIGFGSTFATLFPEPVEYDINSVRRALDYQRGLNADMGGTEVLPALREAFRPPLTGAGWYRQIIFLTDGDVGNADEVIGLVRSNVHQARLFSIGLGMGASTYLVEGVSRAGRGVSSFIRDNNEVRTATMKILKSALQPRAQNVRIRWDVKAQNDDGTLSPIEIIPVPHEIPPIFYGCFTTVYGLFRHEVDLIPPGFRCIFLLFVPRRFFFTFALEVDAPLTGEVILECDVLSTHQEFRIDLAEVMKRHIPSGSVDPDSVNVADLPLHRLAGKCQLNELGDKHKALIMQHHSSLGLKEKDEDLAVTEIRTKLERLSCSINVICPVTAFIGVDPVKKGSEKVSAPVNHTVWTTALVLCYLKLTFPDRSDEWSLFSRKARTWLEAQAMNFTDDAKSAVSYCDALMQKALLTIHPE
ncbi:von Willebrand factor A domain-containing protein 5A [Fasciolopsis buskii]|uniref:von Willebrand factor A domain-containing protein 5A n=1 Tax=Fasciolopsis buskii TaxID=27845 RepID=A0A8E0VJ16_9TREM|nr:von Willebrand factor A domain-containing protein 5A [Fasciolopsis buski]